MNEVRKERTGWRDEELSLRHRRYGIDCPAVDVDFLLIEYDHGTPSALVEYKNEHAKKQCLAHPSYHAISDLASRAGIPALFCRYKDDFSVWRVTPLNEEAKKYVSPNTDMTEQEWVRLLYKIRGYDVPQSVLDGIHVEF